MSAPGPAGAPQAGPGPVRAVTTTLRPMADEWSGEDGLALRHYAQVLWRQKAVVVVTLVVAVGLAAGITARQRTTYVSTTQVLLQPRLSEQLFQPGAGGSGGGGSGSARDPGGIGTEVAVMGSARVREAVEAKLGYRPDVGFQPVEGTQVVVIRAESPLRTRAPMVAQTYAETYVEVRRQQLIDELVAALDTVQRQVADLDAQIAAIEGPLAAVEAQLAQATAEPTIRTLELQREDLINDRQPLLSRKASFEEEADQLRLANQLIQTGGAQVIGDASGPRKANAGALKRNLAAGAGLGLVLGVVGAFVREHFVDSVNRRVDLEAVAPDTPVLALIPRYRTHRRGEPRPVLRSAPRSPAAEAYRSLRTAVELHSAEQPSRLVLVTSPNPAEGKTSIAVNLALATAATGRRVLLVDADLRKSQIHERLTLGNDVGLTSVLTDAVSLADAVQATDTPNLRILTSGPLAPESFELLSDEVARKFFVGIRDQADVVLVDCPPLLPVTDAVLLANIVDAVVLVCRAHRTPKADVNRALELLVQARAPLAGTVLNATERDDGPYYRYGYG